MKELNIFNIREFINEIVMALIFMFTTMMKSQIKGMLVYGLSIIVFLFINRKYIRNVLNK